MTLKEKMETLAACKQYRRWLKESTETEDGGEKQRDYAAEKQAERQPKYAEGWKNFSVMVPPHAFAELQKLLDSLKKQSPQLFDIDSSGKDK